MDKDKNEIPQLFTLEEKSNNKISRKNFIKSTFKVGVLSIVVPGFLIGCEDKDGTTEESIIKSMTYDYIQHSFSAELKITQLGDKLITIGDDEIMTWALPEGILLHSDEIEHVVASCFNSDNTIIVTGHSNSTIKVWSFPEVALILTWSTESRFVSDICISPNDNIIATGGENLKLWDFETGALLYSFPAVNGASSVCFSPDGKYVIGAGGALHIYNMESKIVYKSFSGTYADVKVSGDGKHLAAGSLLMTFPECAFIKYTQPSEGKIKCLEFSPDGKYLVCGNSIDKIVNGIDRNLGIVLIHEMEGNTTKVIDGFDNPITKIAFSPDNTILAINDQAGIVSLFSFPDVVRIATQEYCTCDTICTCDSVTLCTCDSDAPCNCDTVCTVNMVCSCNSVCPSDTICQCVSH